MIDRVLLDFIATLAPDQHRQALLPFDAQARTDWHYIPRDRPGLPLRAMRPAQRLAAMAVLRAALSESGYSRCEDIMRLETVLAHLEQDSETYDPGNYALVLFGAPGNGEPWAWRIEGHHLSLNFTHAADGVSAVPSFFGAHPADVEAGPLTGLRVLGSEEDLGRELMRSLAGAERERALIRPRAFDDILTGPEREESLRQPIGLPYAKLAESQRHLVLRLVEQFLGAMKPSIAEAERRRMREADLARIHFAWAGGLEKHEPHYWRLHGPTLVIEYDNTQDDANHIHSVWHAPGREFGADLLKRHYQHPSHARRRQGA